MIGHQKQHAPAGTYPLLDMMRKHLTQVWPPQIERAAKISEWHKDARWRIGHDREVDTAIHAFQDCNRGRMFSEITLARHPSFRASKNCAMAVGKIEKPVNTFFYG